MVVPPNQYVTKKKSVYNNDLTIAQLCQPYSCTVPCVLWMGLKSCTKTGVYSDILSAVFATYEYSF